LLVRQSQHRMRFCFCVMPAPNTPPFTQKVPNRHRLGCGVSVAFQYCFGCDSSATLQLGGTLGVFRRRVCNYFRFCLNQNCLEQEPRVMIASDCLLLLLLAACCLLLLAACRCLLSAACYCFAAACCLLLLLAAACCCLLLLAAACCCLLLLAAACCCCCLLLLPATAAATATAAAQF